MKKDTFLKIVYICLSVMLIALTIGWVVSGIGYVKNEVFAEEITSNSILDFNQIFKFSTSGSQTNYGLTYTRTDYNLKVSGTTNADNYVWFTFNDLLQVNHIYYFNIENIAPFKSIRYRTATSGNVNITENNYFIITATTTTLQIALNHNSNISFNNTYKPMLVDLTQMFGNGNEPTTIEEIKSYLPLSYYGYTLSTPISLNQLNFENGYNLGYKNGLDIGYKYTNSEIVFKNQVNNFENLNTHNKVNAIINEDNTITYYSNSIGTGYLIPKNKQVIITWEYISSGVIMSLDNGEGSHFELDIDNSNNINSRYVYSFSSSEDASLNLYNDNVENITINNLIVYIANDEQISYDNGYNDGWKDGQKSVDTQSYYDNGFKDGKNWQINHNPNTAWGSSWEFIGSAFSGVGDILSIELLPNVPLWTFIAIPLLFGLIALLYKLIGG